MMDIIHCSHRPRRGPGLCVHPDEPQPFPTAIYCTMFIRAYRPLPFQNPHWNSHNKQFAQLGLGSPQTFSFWGKRKRIYLLYRSSLDSGGAGGVRREGSRLWMWAQVKATLLKCGSSTGSLQLPGSGVTHSMASDSHFVFCLSFCRPHGPSLL